MSLSAKKKQRNITGNGMSDFWNLKTYSQCYNSSKKAATLKYLQILTPTRDQVLKNMSLYRAISLKKKTTQIKLVGKGKINFSNGVPLSLSTTCKDWPHAASNWSTHNELSPFFSCDFVKDKEHKVGG